MSEDDERKHRVLPEGWQIARRWSAEFGRFTYYVQQQEGDVWRDVSGPYRSNSSAQDWLWRKDLREVISARGTAR